VYNNFTAAGISRPYLYTKRIIEIANEHLKDIEADGGYSYQRLLDVLNEKEDKSEYNIVTYFSWFLQNLFSPQFGIAEDEVSSFLVYEDYIHNIAKNSILLDVRNEDLTNKQFIDKVVANIKEFTDNLEESVLLHKKSDEEIAKEEMEAVMATEQEQAMEAQINGAE
jgi:phosphoglucomutase